MAVAVDDDDDNGEDDDDDNGDDDDADDDDDDDWEIGSGKDADDDKYGDYTVINVYVKTRMLLSLWKIALTAAGATTVAAAGALRKSTC